MYEYKCTDLTYSLFQHPATRTRRVDEHMQESAVQGWRLIEVAKNMDAPFAFIARFFWERPASENHDCGAS